jgi:hypothetical protein
MIRRRAEEGAGGEAPEATHEAAPAAPEAAPAPAAPAAPSWQGPSQEEWTQTQQALQYMAQVLSPVEEEEPEQGEIDIESYLESYFQRKMAPVQPLLDLTVKERGEKVMKDIFDAAEKEVGDFDRKLAERVANSFLAEHGGDPVEATKAGAKYAAELRANERKAGVQAHNERLRQGPPDPEPAVQGGAQAARKKATTYDEVIDRWQGETEA